MVQVDRDHLRRSDGPRGLVRHLTLRVFYHYHLLLVRAAVPVFVPAVEVVFRLH